MPCTNSDDERGWPWRRRRLDRSDRGGDGVSIAVIDSGVNPDHPHVGRVAGGVRIDLTGEVSGDYVDRIGHGTAVFAAIQEKAPGAELYAVRVFEDRLRTSVRALVAAIDWAAERRVRVVNLSLGTVREEHAEMLGAAVERLAAVGGVVVAAAEADGQKWWPGSLPSAVGVVMDEDCPRGCVEVRGGAGGDVVVAAAPYPRPIPGVPGPCPRPRHRLPKERGGGHARCRRLLLPGGVLRGRDARGDHHGAALRHGCTGDSAFRAQC